MTYWPDMTAPWNNLTHLGPPTPSSSSVDPTLDAQRYLDFMRLISRSSSGSGDGGDVGANWMRSVSGATPVPFSLASPQTSGSSFEAPFSSDAHQDVFGRLDAALRSLDSAWPAAQQQSREPAPRQPYSGPAKVPQQSPWDAIIESPENTIGDQLAASRRCLDLCNNLIMMAPGKGHEWTFRRCMNHCEGIDRWPQFERFIPFPGK